MKKTIFGIIALLAITGLVMNGCSSDYVASVIPGWHSTLIPNMLFTRLAGLWLIAVILIYFLLLRKETSNTTTYSYLFLTIPFILCDVMLTYIMPVFYHEPAAVVAYISLFIITLIMFIIGQAAFIVRLFSYTIKNRSV